ncbi:putative disease resistance protein RGA3 [Eucalyptus grandis]|uniref:putative disease resistance protein RGA3 n=1 Tax=Eucalyptus grandis TaxID=71139 RepID=UPI00192E99D1|nr:putative disease resistance protein RGA3 [Eucalyptus grandis]
MAEAVLFTLTNDILKLAGSNIFSKIQLARGARYDLKRLKYTVKTIQTMLLDAEKKQWESKQVKLWLVRLKDVLYDAQDLLDDVATEDLRRKVTPGNNMSNFSKSNQLAQPYKVAKRIQEIRKKLDWIAKDREFRLEEHRSEANVAIVRRRTTDSFVRKEDIIGRQIDEGKIMESLLDSSSRGSVSVVPIVGMGGIGKTTLARLAYNNDEVTKYFELKMWVCVSDVFDRDFLIKEILKSARDKYKGDPETTEKLRDIDIKCTDELPKLLRKVLEGKKYLLVLDDLWNEDHGKWSELQSLLMDGSLGSKILVTTRNQSVVEAIGTKSDIYDLKVLPEDKSWDLFKKTAFGDEEEPLNEKLEQIGRDIVKKCGGVPLAIKTIGNLLYAKKEKEWLYFKEHEFSKIDTLNPEIMEVLKISYDHLQPGLKHCFAYCALFPKDYVFNKQTIIQLWMAQGFIESLDEHEEIEEIGDDYVSNLLRGSFLEVEEVNPYTGKVEMFKMHDLMHDLALKVVGNECKMVNLNKGSLDEDTRHASFALQWFSSLQEVTSLLEAANLRTFVSLKAWSYVEKFSPNECHPIFSKFKHCRMLKLNYDEFCIPSSLGSQLKHLRFLEICENNFIKSLPDSITDLLNLQTLKISTCEKLKTLPKDLRKLINLRHLDINKCKSLGSLSCLHTLSELSSLRTLSLRSLNALDFDPLQQSSTTRPFFPSLESLILDSCIKVKGWWRRRRVMIAYQKHQSNNSRLFFQNYGLWI